VAKATNYENDPSDLWDCRRGNSVTSIMSNI